jgi:hypothetical protein
MIKPIETVYNGYRFRSRLEARWAVFFDALGVEYEYEPEGFKLPNGDYYLPDFKVKCYGTRGDIGDTPFDLWIEVKGKMTQDDAEKIKQFANYKIDEYYRGTFCPLGYKDDRITLSPHSDYDDHIRRWQCACGYAICNGDEEVPHRFTCGLSKNTDVVTWPNGKYQNPILIVGNIPPKDRSYDSYALKAYDDMDGIKIHPFNYELIDGDYFAAYPAAHEGKFYLWGDDSNYIWGTKEVEDAYDIARQARFEHGETPTTNRRNY